jgi:hypothetical protein
MPQMPTGFRRGKLMEIKDDLKSLPAVRLVWRDKRVLVAFPAFSG